VTAVLAALAATLRRSRPRLSAPTGSRGRRPLLLALLPWLPGAWLVPAVTVTTDRELREGAGAADPARVP
jgi:hypothetical protein